MRHPGDTQKENEAKLGRATIGRIRLFFGLPVAAHLHPAGWLQLVDGAYRAGALVFGGGTSCSRSSRASCWRGLASSLDGEGATPLPGALQKSGGRNPPLLSPNFEDNHLPRA